jgi:hypothetical protein
MLYKFKRTKNICLTLAFTAVLFSLMVATAEATFTSPPTMDLTTSSNIAGATNAVYSFYAENPDPAVTAVAFSVPIPIGYSVNPAFLTNTPNIVVMTGTYGNTIFPITGYIRLNTTATSGQFSVCASPNNINWVVIGTATIVLPTPTTPGNIGGMLSPLNAGEHVDVSFVAGFFINPSTPGAYAWAPSSATPGDDPTPVLMEPRLGFTNIVVIVGPVGGYLLPLDMLAVVAPYLALIALAVAISLTYTTTRRHKI